MNTLNQTTLFDEQTLLHQATKGDLEAFNQLVLQYQNMAYNHAYALLGNPDQAEDAVQESFIKAFQAMNGFRGGSFRGWLLKIVTNSAFDWLRRSQRHPMQPLFPEDENGEEIESPVWIADPAASVQDRVEEDELSKKIYELLDELPDVYRSVLTLIDIHELDYAEAAEALRVPIGTVKSRLARARLQMQKKLRGSFVTAYDCLGANVPYTA
ncbi:MAG TPA: sigma-70 family RNA polymerase sigma factor [Anaerolineales bacterium]|nr:sigma-70 family RNA polymerase sigma factor [Anaerolineales bacterium]